MAKISENANMTIMWVAFGNVICKIYTLTTSHSLTYSLWSRTFTIGLFTTDNDSVQQRRLTLFHSGALLLKIVMCESVVVLRIAESLGPSQTYSIRYRIPRPLLYMFKFQKYGHRHKCR